MEGGSGIGCFTLEHPQSTWKHVRLNQDFIRTGVYKPKNDPIVTCTANSHLSRRLETRSSLDVCGVFRWPVTGNSALLFTVLRAPFTTINPCVNNVEASWRGSIHNCLAHMQCLMRSWAPTIYSDTFESHSQYCQSIYWNGTQVQGKPNFQLHASLKANHRSTQTWTIF